jgi:hypothetical protein
MKICVISSYLPPPTGIATYTSNYSALTNHRVRVAILSNKGKPQRGAVAVIKAWNKDDVAYRLNSFKQIMSNRCSIIHVQHE